ncbi:MAG: vitamin K epoxide reductase family protein [Reichenbachiella sp.]|uniref:vitamin K epoxide reductase family protein n=1 Tax=Reichenbachiella sp. TaxID=2184521 RepID=UPI002966C7F3|nr:vitamin K epoxide reductase family protein [Reichenbachiella sp.]MDW3208913.1 vitamin K epoxide reductase family protein [Reichenbachiella sp.]
MTPNSAHTLLRILFKSAKVEYSDSFLAKSVKFYRSTMNMKALEDVLNDYNVETMIAKLPFEELQNVDLPIIAEISTSDSKTEIVVIDSIDDENVYLKKSDASSLKLAHGDFTKCWSGIAMLNDFSSFFEHNFDANKKLFFSKSTNEISKKFSISGLLILTLLIVLNYSGGIIFSLLISLKVIGLFIGLKLIEENLGLSSEFTGKFCTPSKRIDCQAVLNSKGGSILGVFNLSDLGAIYFLSTFLFSLFSILDNNTSLVYSVLYLNYLALPIILYAILYQFFVVKKLCPLCIALQVLIIIEFILGIIYGDMDPVNVDMILRISVYLLLSNIFIVIYKKLITKEINEELLEKKEFYNKRNFEFLKFVFSSGQKTSELNSEIKNYLSFVEEGNELIVVLSPLCQPCSVFYAELEKFIAYFDERINVRFVFIEQNRNNPLGTKVVNYINDYLRVEPDLVKRRKFIGDYFSIKNKNSESIQKWMSIGSLNKVDAFESTLEIEWCKENGIHYTPALILNNHIIPAEFGLLEIRRYLDKFQEEERL